MKRWIPIVAAAILAGLGLAGCARTVPETRYYFIELPEPEGGSAGIADSAALEPAAAGPAGLTVMRLASGPGLESDHLAYVPESHRLGYYAHHRWVEPPAELIGLRLQRELALALPVPVRAPSSGSEADWRLSGTVTAFHETDEPDVWYGAVGLDLEITRADSGRVVWKRFYCHREQARERTPGAVVDALNAALDAIMPRIVSDVARVVR